MSATGADRFHRTEYSGKNLAAAASFHSGFDNIANAGDARFFPGTDDSQRCFGDASIAQDHFLQCLFIDLEPSRAIAKRSAQTDLMDRIISHLKPHLVTRSPPCS